MILVVLSTACWSVDKPERRSTCNCDTSRDGGTGDDHGDVETVDFFGDSNPLVWIAHDGGTFEMGGAMYADEAPVHDVTVAAFEMLKTEVTGAQYRFCVSSGECPPPEQCGLRFSWRDGGPASAPVNCIDHEAAAAFCAYAGGRLPSEAEWEYAARGGGAAQQYPWGDEEADCDLAIMSADDDTEVESAWGCDTGALAPVCSRLAGNTPAGLCDMAGNVFEWVADTYHATYEDAPSNAAAWVDGGSAYVIRGGGFYSDAVGVLATRRGYSDSLGTDIGFRCARSR